MGVITRAMKYGNAYTAIIVHWEGNQAFSNTLSVFPPTMAAWATRTYRLGATFLM